MQIFDGVQKPYFDQGDYFTKTNDSAPIAHPPAAEALCKAWARFEERARRSFRCAHSSVRSRKWPTSPRRSSTTLMGDDEEHRRDEFENDYQLDSDVETFESLTGKKIRPIISS